ncbi:MAG: hypothetical protein JNK89_10155, partial [Saprospiraceae bacterium]|nr:hypothetical protein [Saprospiraceae bacterium]
LYVSLGGFAGLFPQKAGLAVIDVSNPAQAVVTGLWSDPAFDRGCAAVRVDGNYAYLGAMDKGVIVVDISNPAAPKLVSKAELDPDWPHPPGIFTEPHARGFAVRGDEVWTCFDAGALRLVNVFDKQNPVEAYKYVNEDIEAAGQIAYNTAIIAGNYLYAAVDYCGIDIVDISKPEQPVNAGWINPWNCNNVNWNGRPGHTNQLATACNNQLLFASGADTEVLAWSLANPTQPHLIGQHATLLDSAATWGIDVNDSLVALAFVWNPLNIPYIAKKGGIQLLRWSCPTTSPAPESPNAGFDFLLAPNPCTDRVTVQASGQLTDPLPWALYDLHGRQLLSGILPPVSGTPEPLKLQLGHLPAGIYCFALGGVRRLVVRQ